MSAVMSNLLLVACLVFSLSLALGQILFKLAANDIKGRLATSLMQAAFSPWLISAIGMYVLVTALWIAILTRLPLSKAYPFSLLGAAFVPLMARMIFGESLPSSYLIGLIVVLLGVAIINLK